MRVLRPAGPLALGCGGILALLAAPAGADLSGPCAASGVFEKSEVIVDAETNEVIEVEAEDEVSYTATVTGATPPRKTSGEVKVDMPFPFPDYKAGDWSDDDAGDVEKVDTYSYDLPAIAPRGLDVEVSGFHQDAGLPKCAGSVTLHIKGGFFSSPAGPVAVVITVISAAGVVMAARPKGGV